MSRGICLVGLGPHAKRIYYRYIVHEVTGGSLMFDSLIELSSRKVDVDEFFLDKEIKPTHIVFADETHQRNPEVLDPHVQASLNKAIDEKRIQCAIVATEPKAHKIYIDYFLKHNIPVLTDKPLTAPVGSNYDINSAEKIFSDAVELSDLSTKYKTPLYVQVQRREHPAYIRLFEKITRIVEEYRLPITFFDIYHSDGTWSMPEEFSSRENHPYKYGYGKLMHSGYHFVDLVAWVASINMKVFPSLYIENNTKLLKPDTQYRQIQGNALYKKLFGKETVEPPAHHLGEVDAYSSFEFKDGERLSDSGNTITFGHLDLLQSGFSKRAWFDLPKDTYKGNGRLRHERINIHVGPLLNIQLHSYQSDEINKGHTFGVGGEEHLDIYIFRNNTLIGGNAFEHIDYGSEIEMKHRKTNGIYIGHNELPRNIIFQQFLARAPSNALVKQQLLTNQILSHMYISAIRERSETITKENIIK